MTQQDQHDNDAEREGRPRARADLSPEEAAIRDDEPAAYNIGGWCRAHSVSYQFYAKMKRLGVGPVESVVAGKPFITREAAREWRAALLASAKD